MCAEGRARKPPRLQDSSPTVSSGPSAPRGARPKGTDELTRKVGESLTPRLRKLEGFGGYYLIEAEEGVWSSVNFYDTSAHADESTRVVAEWLREEKLEEALPNPPKITDGTVIVQEL